MVWHVVVVSVEPSAFILKHYIRKRPKNRHRLCQAVGRVDEAAAFYQRQQHRFRLDRCMDQELFTRRVAFASFIVAFPK